MLSHHLPPTVLSSVADSLGLRADQIEPLGSVGGGSIHPTQRLKAGNQGTFFLKWSTEGESDRFLSEEKGLEALAKSNTVKVATTITCSSSPPFILLQWIEQGRVHSNTLQELGRDLASLHRTCPVPDSSVSGRFGFDHDNYLGETPQPNAWQDHWPTFFKEQRLGFQLDLLWASGQLDKKSRSQFEGLLQRLDDLLSEPNEPPCLLHGDLWGGNYVVDQGGTAVLIDPAAYLGRREADLAMTRLFGGFVPSFYQAYEEVWPLEPGSVQRLEIYKLYHLLNHWNLFGSSYRHACLSIASKFQ